MCDTSLEGEVLMELTEHRFEEFSKLGYAIHTCPFPSRKELQALVVSFDGYVRPRREDDATFMEVITKAALIAWDSHGLILDFRNLRYGPGSDIGAVHWAPEGVDCERPCPTRMVFSASNYGWLLGILEAMEIEAWQGPGDPPEPLFDEATWLAGSLEEALEAIEKKREDNERRFPKRYEIIKAT
jgi:hypothetical protein